MNICRNMNTPQQLHPTHQPRLLLVDDDPAMIRIISEMLAEFPDQRFATTGETALALAREATPDVILLDANLPNMTGFDVCEILKRDARLARVPVIFVTSHDAPALEVDAFRMGAADYVIKPLVASRLQARVRAQLRLRKRVMEALARLPVDPSVPSQLKSAPTHVLAILAADTAEAHHDALEAIGKLHVTATIGSALKFAQLHTPSVIVLDARCCAEGPLDSPCAVIGEALDVLLAAHPQVPVVVLADACDVDVEQRTLDAGAADIIAKPAKPAVVQARVLAALSSTRKAEEEIRALLDSSSRASVHLFPGVSREANGG
jgi:two-component system, cell cycle response regulator